MIHETSPSTILARSRSAGVTVVMAAALAMAMLLSSSAFAQAPERIFRLAEVADHQNFDPAIATSGPDRTVQLLIYNNLVKLTPELDIAPDLALSWSASDDGLAWTFNLDPAAVFADGSPITAGDVKFSWERVLDPTVGAPRRSTYTAITGIEVIDDHTVVLRTDVPFPDLLEAAADGSVATVSEAFVTGLGAPYGLGIGSTLVSGPYVPTSWDPGSRMVLERNPNWWREPAFFERIEILPVREGLVRVAMVRTGEVDMAVQIIPEEVESLRGSPGIAIVEYPEALQIGLELNLTKPPLDDVRVRQAMRYAIDYDAIIESIFDGRADAATSPTGPVRGRATFDPWPHDMERAQELIREAGAQGATIVFHSPRGRYLKDAETAEAIQAYLTLAGLNVELSFIEWATYLERQDASSPRMLAMVGRAAPYLDFNLWRLFHSLTTTEAAPPIIHRQYSNPEVDRLLEVGRTISTDFAERTVYYDQAQALMWEDSSLIPLWTARQAIAIRDTVQGFIADPSGRIRLDDVYKTP
jgi:peptide/nickel transport system substrate-binding protein